MTDDATQTKKWEAQVALKINREGEKLSYDDGKSCLNFLKLDLCCQSFKLLPVANVKKANRVNSETFLKTNRS